jgi:hypothetical protein
MDGNMDGWMDGVMTTNPVIQTRRFGSASIPRLSAIQWHREEKGAYFFHMRAFFSFSGKLAALVSGGAQSRAFQSSYCYYTMYNTPFCTEYYRSSLLRITDSDVALEEHRTHAVWPLKAHRVTGSTMLKHAARR